MSNVCDQVCAVLDFQNNVTIFERHSLNHRILLFIIELHTLDHLKESHPRVFTNAQNSRLI